MWVSMKKEAPIYGYTYVKYPNYRHRTTRAIGIFSKLLKFHWTTMENIQLLFVILQELPCTSKLFWCVFNSVSCLFGCFCF